MLCTRMHCIKHIQKLNRSKIWVKISIDELAQQESNIVQMMIVKFEITNERLVILISMIYINTETAYTIITT